MTSIPVPDRAGGLAGIDSLLHVRALSSASATREHRTFVACHLAAGTAALAALPLYLTFAGVVTGPGAILAALLAFPLVIALYAIRTGALDRAHVLSVIGSATLLAGLAAVTGGLFSGVIPALVIALGLGFAMGNARTRNAVITVSVGTLVAIVTGHYAGFVFPADLAMLPIPVWLAGLLIAAPAMLHAMTWIASARQAMDEHQDEAGNEIALQRRMIDNAADLVTLHNRAGNLVEASAAARRLLGVEPDAMRDAGLFNRVHVADRPGYLRLLDAAQSGQEHDSTDIRVRVGDLSDGAPRYEWFEMRCRAIPASRDVVAVLRETGQRMAHEEERDEAIAEAQRANGMKTRFLASVSHELRTPLNAIIGFSEVLEQELFGKFEQDKNREYAGLIHQSGRHLLDVVNDILDMSKIEAGKFEIFAEPFDLSTFLKGPIAMLSGKAAEKSVEIELAIEPHLPELNADQRACKQICLNLLSNAIKFTRTDTAEGTSKVQLSGFRRGRFIHLVVRDNGIGISPEDLVHVGEPFYQAQSNYARGYEGTGLGLSVVNGLVALHGGRLEIDSTLGLGTTVTVILPIAGPEGERDEADHADVTQLQPRSVKPGDPRLVVAEDLATVTPFARRAS